MDRVGFYSDWKAGKYGPYSPSLDDDIDTLARSGLLIIESIESPAGYTLNSFKVTPRGGDQALALERSNSRLADAIKKTIVDKYARAPLMSILHDTYYLAPQYTTESEIAADVFDVGKRRDTD
jgi:uncharacterized protein YwgA